MMENYLSPNTSDFEAIELIRTKIRASEPFAFTRFGDGEIYVLNKKSYPEFEKKNCLEWGYKYPEEIQNFYEDGSEIIRSAFIHSDLIGIMNKNCDIVRINYSPKTWSIEKTLMKGWGLNPENLTICDHQLSRQKILGSVEGMKNILQGKSVHIISTNVEKLESKNLSNLLDCEVTYTFHSKDINFNNREDFLKSFEKIKSEVVLLGVGLQKDYTTILKNKHGKISLDMGATLDAWASIYSRPWFQKGGLQEHLIID
jgi:hypothetical protein